LNTLGDDTTYQSIITFEQSCLDDADPLFFLTAIQNAQCPTDAGPASPAPPPPPPAPPPPPPAVAPGTFTVRSGPCTVSDGGRCVGRAGGYLPSEFCVIIVGGGGGALGACGVFDTYDSVDYVILPDGSRHGGSDCPVGAALSPGDSVGWASNDIWQGSAPTYSMYGLGGGWQICFA
jgi:hypothetical protein